MLPRGSLQQILGIPYLAEGHDLQIRTLIFLVANWIGTVVLGLFLVIWGHGWGITIGLMMALVNFMLLLSGKRKVIMAILMLTLILLSVFY